MCGAALCLAMVAAGVDVGWRRLPDGGMEYIIQIEPHVLDMLKSGEQIISDIPPHLRGVRSYRIQVGTQTLPREQPPEPPPEPPPRAETAEPGQPGFRLPGTELGEASPPAKAILEPSGRASPPAFSLSEPPRPFPSPTETQPISALAEKAASFVDQPADKPRPPADERAPADTKTPEPAKPWVPLTLALAGLFGSFGGMLYASWIAWGYRRQYQTLLCRLIAAGQGQLMTSAGVTDEGTVEHGTIQDEATQEGATHEDARNDEATDGGAMGEEAMDEEDRQAP